MVELSVGADFSGTLQRGDSLAQLGLVQKDLRFRYIRFHNVFADQLGVYREVNGKPDHDWRKIDRLYDRLLGIGLKPFIELGFTLDAMKTSRRASTGRATRRIRSPRNGQHWSMRSRVT